MTVVFSSEQAAASLWDYGEDELVDRALALTGRRAPGDLVHRWEVLEPGYSLPVTSQRVVLGHVNALAVITYLDANTGWAVGGNATILATTDGGATWTAQTSPTTATLLSVAPVGTDRAWAVGTNGTILAYR